MLELLNSVSTVADDGGSSSWIMLVVLAGLFILMLVMTILPQRKRKKQAQEMINSLRVGSQVKTIGGFVGVIKAIDEATNTLIINIAANDENEMLVTLDRSAIYTVMTPGQESAPVVETAAVNDAEVVVSADDAEEAVKAEAKRAEKKAKKAKKDAEKAKKAEAEDAVVANVEPEADKAETVEAEVVESDNKVDF